MERKKLISIVIPAYNEEAVVDELARQLQAVFDQNAGYEFEVILVENGSEDETFARMEKIHQSDPRFKILRLSRNFRCDGGITAGLQFARGEAAVIMTADLQDPPEMITPFIQKWEEGYDNVFGIVTKRSGSHPLRRMNSELFYLLINKVTHGLFPRNASDFRLVDRRIYEVINRMPERNRFLRGMFSWAGFRSIGLPHERPPRFAGEAKSYTWHVIELALKGILEYTYLPLKAITILGLVISATSLVLMVVVIGRVLIFGVPFPGFGTIMTVMLMMFGFLFVCLGVMSEYVGLIYEEVKQRPNFIIQETLGLEKPPLQRGALPDRREESSSKEKLRA